MKKIYLLIFTIACFHIAKAQNPVPNPYFDNWTSGNPVGWSTTNESHDTTMILQVSPGYDGHPYAAKGQPFGTAGNTVAPFLNTIGSGVGFSIHQNYDSLGVFYKSNLLNNDTFEIAAELVTAHGNPLAVTVDYIVGDSTQFTEDILPEFYYFYQDSTAASAIILFFLTNSVPVDTGSYFIVGYTTLTPGSGSTTGIKELSVQNKLQVYPVPAHDWLTVKGETTNNKPMQFELIDAMGRVVMDKKSQTPSNNFIDTDFNLQGLSPGLYSLMMITDEEVSTRRIVVE